MSAWRESAGRVAAVARKELLHLSRDRITVGMVAGFPLVATMIFGLAINQDVRHLAAGVADLAGTQRARELVLDAQASQVIDLERSAQSAEALEQMLVQGDGTGEEESTLFMTRTSERSRGQRRLGIERAGYT